MFCLHPLPCFANYEKKEARIDSGAVLHATPTPFHVQTEKKDDKTNNTTAAVETTMNLARSLAGKIGIRVVGGAMVQSQHSQPWE